MTTGAAGSSRATSRGNTSGSWRWRPPSPLATAIKMSVGHHDPRRRAAGAGGMAGDGVCDWCAMSRCCWEGDSRDLYPIAGRPQRRKCQRPDRSPIGPGSGTAPTCECPSVLPVYILPGDQNRPPDACGWGGGLRNACRADSISPSSTPRLSAGPCFSAANLPRRQIPAAVLIKRQHPSGRLALGRWDESTSSAMQ